MQGFERMGRKLTDAAAVAGHLIPAGSMFAFLAAQRAEVFRDADYADLFAPPGLGRPSIPATQMAAVLTLQVLHDYSDRETAEAVRFGVRWKAAIGAALDDAGFDPSTLVYWRNRIARSERPHRVNEAVRTVIAETGVLKGRPCYRGGASRGAVADAGNQAVIKPKPLRPPVEGGLTVDDFTVDEQAGTVTCPAGHAVKLSRTRIATFGALCRHCPLRPRCTTCKTGRKLVLHLRDDLLRAARADWAVTGLRKDYTAWRPNMERAIAQVATWRSRRLKLRYRGTTRNHAWLKRRRQQVPAVRRGLDRTLGSQARAQSRAARGERRPRKRGDRAVGVPGEPVDGVGGGGVAVDVGVAHHW